MKTHDEPYKTCLGLAGGLVLAAIPVFAHHRSHRTSTGNTAEPHALVYINAKLGTVTSNWTIELANPKVLAGYG